MKFSWEDAVISLVLILGVALMAFLIATPSP